MGTSFLNQFDNQNYTNNAAPSDKGEKASDDLSQEIIDRVKEETSSIKTPASSGKAGAVTPAVKGKAGKGKAAITGPEHVVEKDTGYHKRKLIRYGVIAFAVLAVCLSAFLIFRFVNQVEVKNFVGTSLSDAKTWGLANSVTLETETVYNLEYDENIIVEQDKEADSKIQKGSVLKLKVSKGPDPEEQIEIPDFKTMNTAEVREWKQEIKALNVSINEEYSETVDEGAFIRMEFTSSSVTAETYTRQDGLLVYMSKGAEVFEKNITVPDFADKTKAEVEVWVKENGIEATYEEAASDTILAGNVISQSAAAGEKVAKNDEMTFTISLGKSVTVPNFNNLTMDAAEALTNLAVTVQRRYSTSVSYGKVISQSEAAGTELVGDSPSVTVQYSIGKPYIDNLIGTSEKDLPEYFYGFSSQGANITYSVTYIDSSEPKGNIVKMSKYAEYVGLETNVNIYVSKGNLAAPVSASTEE